MLKQKTKIPEGWKEVLLSSVVNICTGKKDVNEGSLDGKYPFFSCSQKILKSDEYSFDAEAILLAGNGDFNIKYFQGKFEAYQRTYILTNKGNNNLKFLYFVLFSNIQNITKNNQGSTIKYIRIGDIENFKILLPPLSIQNKIAEILETVDEEIEKVEKIVEKSEKIKIGIMNKVFKNKNKTIILKHACLKIIGGGTPRRSEESYWGGKIPWVTVKDLTEKTYLVDAQECITEKGLKESVSNLIPKNNIITSTRMGIGRFYINTVDLAINQDLKALIINQEKFDIDYLYWQLKFLGKFLESKGVGSTVKGIKLNVLENLKITNPDLNEQKIASTALSAYQNKIYNYINIKRELIQLKKGLMADLLNGKKII